MDDDIDIGKYAWALRRSWRAISIVALMGLLAGAFVGSRSTYSSVFVLQSIVRRSDLQAADIDGDDLDLTLVTDLITDEIGSSGFRDETRTAVADSGIELSARLVDRSSGPAVVVEVSGPESATVDRAADLVTDRARTGFVTQVDDRLAASGAATEDILARATERLGEVEQALAEAGSAQPALIDALVTEDERLRRQVNDLEAGLSALDRYRNGVSDDLLERGRAQPKRSSDILRFGLAGLIGGAFVAALVVLVRAFFDRSIRSRRDLDRIGLHQLIAAIPRSYGDALIGAAAAAVAHTATSAGAHSVQLVPVSPTADVSSWTSALADRLDRRVPLVVRQSLEQDAEAADHAGKDVLTVLAVRWGADRRETVSRDANTLAAAGAEDVAVLLFDVPESGRARIEA